MRSIMLAVFFTPVVAHAQQVTVPPAQIARIDSIFSAYNRPDGPGCALGVSRHDSVVLARAWGSAQLEFAIPNTPLTKFEAGSVSKQFTAAAILRLAQQGRLSLDDDVRRYVPELPTYDSPITIQHLIHHTSGLRDWGTVMTIAGWPRGTRTYTHAHVLEILGRQRALNYPVGTEYLYSNSNYNLLAIIAERVSGKSLAEFTRQEIFEPLGMTETGWRDDYTRVVARRSQAYSPRGTGWRLDMPFENVYGNSSLLTTVGDLLKWNANLGQQKVGGPKFVASQLERGRLKSGREIRYAGGMFIGELDGTREIWHDGATAGYRAFLARYPDAGYAVAMLCNAGNADPGALGRQVARVFLPPRAPTVASARDTVGSLLAPDLLSRLAGNYRSVRSDEPLRFVVASGRLRQLDGPALVALNDREFTSISGRTHLIFDPGPRGEITRIRTWVDDSDTTYFLPAGNPAAPEAFKDYVGTYTSYDADVTVRVAAENQQLVLLARPNNRYPLTPIYRDGFSAVGSFFNFTRGSNGQVNGFRLSSGRARNLRFERDQSAASVH
jgi:CubicO group peptidase (beta-lactamase class C family)